jgi:hypothetical protein
MAKEMSKFTEQKCGIEPHRKDVKCLRGRLGGEQ